MKAHITATIEEGTVLQYQDKKYLVMYIEKGEFPYENHLICITEDEELVRLKSKEGGFTKEEGYDIIKILSFLRE